MQNLSESTEIEVALFPIPGMVAFPGTVVPLHVFEPRYRKLIHQSISAERWVAVSNTRKVIHEPAARGAQDLQQALNSNQATYQAYDVFSAGPVEIVDTLEDGRMLVQIDVQARLQLVSETQALPYRIALCKPRQDSDEPELAASSQALQGAIHKRIRAIVAEQYEDAQQALDGADWASMSAADYSCKIFQFLRFEPEMMQEVLEMDSVNARLALIADLLHA